MELSLCIGRIQLTYLFYGPLFSYPFENYIYQGIEVLLHTPFKEKWLLFEVILVPDISGIKSGLSSFNHSSKSFINTQMETDQQLLPESVC